jgi:hypothetical protein
MPELLKSLETIYDFPLNENMIIEGGPIDSLIQCGEKIWFILNVNTPPYVDQKFIILGKIAKKILIKFRAFS